MNRKLAIIGGGPAALLTYKRLLEKAPSSFEVHIFEKTTTLGQGMPYSERGASIEHVTNVSSNELPELVSTLKDWVKAQPSETLKKFDLEPEDFHEKEVLPRLLFGQYLTAQFDALLGQARAKKMKTELHYNAKITDISDDERLKQVILTTQEGDKLSFDHVVICTGHHWTDDHEGQVEGYFDSPYPPAKLARQFDHTVIVRGSSLTAVDAIRTMARANGTFSWKNSKLVFKVNDDSSNFRISMHSRHGMLPCVRVHMEDPHVAGEPLIPEEEIQANLEENDGFLELDFLFEEGFKKTLQEKDPTFFRKIKNMRLEDFVEEMMAQREAMEPFALFRKEYEEAQKSIDQERPVYWKEMLSALSFAMNYPAKHFSAEDMMRLHEHLSPLISVVIAFMPQSSCEELMALNDAGRLELIADEGAGGTVEITDDNKITYSFEDESGKSQTINCQTFVDCSGQKHLSIANFPFQTLVKQSTISGARSKFRSRDRGEEAIKKGIKEVDKVGDDYYLSLCGASISDNFQLIDQNGQPSDRIYLMAVPYMGGFNPDYSGLDFCEHASELIVDSITTDSPTPQSMLPA